MRSSTSTQSGRFHLTEERGIHLLAHRQWLKWNAGRSKINNRFECRPFKNAPTLKHRTDRTELRKQTFLISALFSSFLFSIFFAVAVVARRRWRERKWNKNKENKEIKSEANRFKTKSVKHSTLHLNRFQIKWPLPRFVDCALSSILWSCLAVPWTGWRVQMLIGFGNYGVLRRFANQTSRAISVKAERVTFWAMQSQFSVFANLSLVNLFHSIECASRLSRLLIFADCHPGIGLSSTQPLIDSLIDVMRRIEMLSQQLNPLPNHMWGAAQDMSWSQVSTVEWKSINYPSRFMDGFPSNVERYVRRDAIVFVCFVDSSRPNQRSSTEIMWKSATKSEEQNAVGHGKL